MISQNRNAVLVRLAGVVVEVQDRILPDKSDNSYETMLGISNASMTGLTTILTLSTSS